MKAEDIKRAWSSYTMRSDGPVMRWDELSQLAKDAFAALCRACEQHGVERAKSGVQRTCEKCGGIGLRHCFRCNGTGSHEAQHLSWSALDAEIEKENEG